MSNVIQEEIFTRAIVFVSKMQESLNKQFPSSNSIFDIIEGRKYLKVITNNGVQQSVTAFIDKNDGQIYKPAGWKAPAKYARGNLFDNYGEKALSENGWQIRYL